MSIRSFVERPRTLQTPFGRQHGSFRLKVAPRPPIAIYEWINRANPSLFATFS